MRIKRIVLLATWLPLVLALLPVRGASAAECPVGVQVNAENTPGDSSNMFRITVPGSYCLTHDVTAAKGQSGIRIAAQDVTLDLMGFTVEGSLEGSGIGIAANLPFSSHRYVIKNGSVRHWDVAGVALGGAYGEVSHLRAHTNSGDGFHIQGVSLAVRHCEALGNGGAGIRAVSFSDLVVEHSYSGNNIGDGFVVNGVGLHMHHNRASGNGFGDPFIERPPGANFHLLGASGNRIEDNIAFQDLYSGEAKNFLVESSARNLIVRNSATRKAAEVVNYDIAPGNLFSLSRHPASAGPWDNFDIDLSDLVPDGLQGHAPSFGHPEPGDTISRSPTQLRAVTE